MGEEENIFKSQTSYSINNDGTLLLAEGETPTPEDGTFFENKEATGDDVSKSINPTNRIYYEIFFVVMPLFCGYATLFSMQREVEQAMYGDPEDEPKIFGHATSMLYVGNLVFRLGHNIVFWFGGPRTRVVIALLAMIISMATIASIFLWFNDPKYIALVFIGYGFGGVAVGTFESNVLSMITVLGKDTKLWAIIAIPVLLLLSFPFYFFRILIFEFANSINRVKVGINVVNIGGFILLAVWPWLQKNPVAIHLSVLVYCFIGLLILFVRLFWICKSVVNTFSIKEFIGDFRFWKQWLWVEKWHCCAMVFDMFCVSLFSPGVILYIYSGACVQFTLTGWTMNDDAFIATYNTFFFLGDTISRKLFYNVRLINPFFFLIFSAVGIIIGLSDITILVPLTALGVAFANGSLYTQTNRLIDQKIPERFNLISLSFWLFIGDIGSVVGSNIISPLSTVIKNVYKPNPNC